MAMSEHIPLLNSYWSTTGIFIGPRLFPNVHTSELSDTRDLVANIVGSGYYLRPVHFMEASRPSPPNASSKVMRKLRRFLQPVNLWRRPDGLIRACRRFFPARL